jgi:membrane protein
VASAGFSVYLANFGSYERVYGVLGTAIAFLVWAWILNLTLLGGLEVSLALGRARSHGQTKREVAAPPESSSPAAEDSHHNGA